MTQPLFPSTIGTQSHSPKFLTMKTVVRKPQKNDGQTMSYVAALHLVPNQNWVPKINTVPTPTVAWTKAWLLQRGGGYMKKRPPVVGPLATGTKTCTHRNRWGVRGWDMNMPRPQHSPINQLLWVNSTMVHTGHWAWNPVVCYVRVCVTLSIFKTTLLRSLSYISCQPFCPHPMPIHSTCACLPSTTEEACVRACVSVYVCLQGNILRIRRSSPDVFLGTNI